MKNEIIYSYLIEDTTNNLYKIGKSNDPTNRLKTLKISNPFIKLIGISLIKEKYLHQFYFKYRIVGEWFNFPNEIKNEVFKLFKPITEKPAKNKSWVLANYYMNEFVILEQQKNYQGINNLSNRIFNKIGSKNYRKLLAEDDEFNRIVSSAIYMNL